MYLSIAIKLAVAMMGVLFFLRLSGKTQMAQVTPVNTVNAFVLGAMIGGVIYTPDLSVWYLVYAMAVWSLINAFINYLSRHPFFQRLIHGRFDFIIKDNVLDEDALNRNHLTLDQLRAMLREKDVYSLLDVQELRFETNGEITVAPAKDIPASYLFIENGAVQDENLHAAKQTRRWLMDILAKQGIHKAEDVYGAEWTQGHGMYIILKEGKILRLKAAELKQHARRHPARKKFANNRYKHPAGRTAHSPKTDSAPAQKS